MSTNKYECRYPACECSSKDNCIEERKRQNDALIAQKQAANGENSGIDK